MQGLFSEPSSWLMCSSLDPKVTPVWVVNGLSFILGTHFPHPLFLCPFVQPNTCLGSHARCALHLGPQSTSCLLKSLHPRVSDPLVSVCSLFLGGRSFPGACVPRSIVKSPSLNHIPLTNASLNETTMESGKLPVKTSRRGSSVHENPVMKIISCVKHGKLYVTKTGNGG